MKLNRTNASTEEEDTIDLQDEPMDEKDSMLDQDYLGDDLGDDYFGEGGQSPMQKHSDLLKGLTNFSPYLKESFNNWLGVVWDEETKEFKSNPLIPPIMTINGATWSAGLIKTYVRDNNIITHINLEDYRNILADHIEAVWLNLGTRDEFGLKSNGDLLRVCNELEHAAALTLMGAGEGKYTKFLGTTIQRHESVGNSPMQTYPQGMASQQSAQKAGIFDRIKQKLIGRM